MAEKKHTSVCVCCELPFSHRDRGQRLCSRKCAGKLQAGDGHQRFLSKLEVQPNGCLLWTGAKTSRGYGAIQVDGRQVGTHRYAWEVANGPIPDGKLVCHHCDVRLCCNESHLFLGSPAENMADRDSKGRQSKGTDFSSAKLTENSVMAIRASTFNQHDEALKHGVSKTTIHQVRSRKSWKHLG